MTFSPRELERERKKGGITLAAMPAYKTAHPEEALISTQVHSCTLWRKELIIHLANRTLAAAAGDNATASCTATI
jgi:hypothetical protein